MIGCAVCGPVATTIWSSLFRSSNCWRASRRLDGAATLSSRRPCCASVISRWIWYPGPRAEAARTLGFFPANSSFWSIWSATKAGSCRGRCYCSTSGICISIHPPTSSTSMSGAYAARSMAIKPIHSSTRFEVLGIVSVLLAKTLTSSTFTLALIAIGTFGLIVSGILSHVYLSTSSYVRGRSDRAIKSECSDLLSANERTGRDGLVALIKQSIAGGDSADNVYLLVDPSLAVLAGNLRAWPSTVTTAEGG